MDGSSSNETDTFFAAENDLFYASNIYKPLAAERQAIRLLKILPGIEGSEVRCELITSVFLTSRHVPYQALSYSAGNLRDTVKIKVQGVEFNTFRSVETWMKQYRLRDGPLVWIDQICINQSDHEEKAKQVMLMRSIYAAANKVILWLGDELPNDDAADAMSFLRHLNTTVKIQYVAKILETGNLDINEASRVAIHRRCAEKIVTEIQSGIRARELKALNKMLSKSWWTRCWVLQEIIVAETVEIHWGRQSIVWDDFETGHTSLTYIYQNLLTSITRRELIETPDIESSVDSMLQLNLATHSLMLLQLKEKWEKDRKLRLREVLNVSRTRGSTDPRDRIYAILGLVNPHYEIIPSYLRSNSTADVFVTAAKAAIQRDECLDILSDANEVNRNHALGLPTWVPDFSTATGRFVLCNWQYGREKSEYDASWQQYQGDAPFKRLPPPDFLPDGSNRAGTVLQCIGVDVGPVSRPECLGAVSKLMTDPDSAEDLDVTKQWKTCMEAMGMKLSDPYGEGGASGQSVEAAFYDTLGARPMQREEFREVVRADRTAEVLIGDKWRFFVTSEKVMGIAPSNARHDDRIYVLFQASVPFILRKLGNETGRDFELVGPVYLHGYMYGNAVAEWMIQKRDAYVIKIH